MDALDMTSANLRSNIMQLVNGIQDQQVLETILEILQKLRLQEKEESAPLTESQKRLLDERLAELDANGEKGISWEELQAKMQSRR
ncbi:MAG: addiction module protein [Salibacteraceae bacterium]